MIGYLKGKVIKVSEKYVILNVNGVGYKVHTETVNINLNSEMDFFIHTIVREDALELFGFIEEMTLSLFEKLISISGIGPRSALSILSVGPTEKLTQAIHEGDLAYLTSISGIGKKTAEKIVLELRGALSDLEMNDKNEEVMMALKSLGYKDRDIKEVLKKVKDGSTEEKLKTALKYLQ